MKINFTAISVIILAISIFASALIVSNQLKTTHNSTAEPVESTEQLTDTKQLLTKKEIAMYLGITIRQFDELDKIQIAFSGRGVPFLVLGNTQYYTIQSIEKWLSDLNNYQANELLDD